MSWHEFIFSDRPGHRIRRHLIFWLLWWIYFAATYYYYGQIGLQKIAFGSVSSILILKTFFLIAVHILSCYAFIYFLLPRYLIKAKYFSLAAGITLLILFLLASGYIIHSQVFPFIDQLFNYDAVENNSSLWWTSINSVLLTAPKIIAAATAIKLIKRWYLKQKEKEKVEKEKLITDLQLLKAQVRPDFLFSSLDHIYTYAKNKSPKAQELLLKFSDLLSYLLYECDDAKVSLEKELTLMKEYMFMEKIRFDKNLEMEIVVKGNAGNKTIAPLLLLPFIENSFKQCNSHSEQSWINLELSIEDNILTMKLINGVDIDKTEQVTLSNEIINVQKRLQLLYPANYELKMYTEQEICVTFLKINLNEKFDLQHHQLLSITTNQIPSMPLTKKIKCLVIDDEQPARDILQKHIEGVESLELAGSCNNAVEALSFLQSNTVDLLFLDIQMPHILGTNFIRTLKNPPKVIFTTAYRKYAVEGFELDAVDFLLKPIGFDRFLKAVNKIFQLNLQSNLAEPDKTENNKETAQPFLYFRSDRKMVKVLFNDILYIEGLRDYIKIFTTTKTIITKHLLASLQEMLPADTFLRIHRSYIVSINKIDSYRSDIIEIAKKELPIGRLYKHDVNKLLNTSSFQSDIKKNSKDLNNSK